jgi:hypothetical protein
MQAKDIEMVCSHLEFLGYKIEFDNERYFASKHQKRGIMFRETEYGINLLIAWTPHASVNKLIGEYFTYVNELNKFSLIGRFWIAEDYQLCFATFFLFPYSKEAFNSFIEFLDYEVGLLFTKEIGDASAFLK